MEQQVIEGYRLSPQQKHLWSFLESDSAAVYRSRLVLIAEGALSLSGLRAAVQRVVERNEVLRTRFVQAPGMSTAVQMIEPSAEVKIEELELSAVAAADEGLAAVLSRMAEAARGERDGELRVQLVKESEQRVGLVLTVSAMQADEQGMKNLAQEIVSSYEAIVQNKTDPELPLQYADLAQWQNELLESEDSGEEGAFWQKEDLAKHSQFTLPFARLTPSEGSFDPHKIEIEITGDKLEELELLSARFNTDISVLLLGAWAALLSKLSGEEEVVVGTQFDGRNYEELKEAVGLLARYLPIHTRLQPDLRFATFIKQLDEELRNAAELQDYFDWATVNSGYWQYGYEHSRAGEVLAGAGAVFQILTTEVCLERYELKLRSVQYEDRQRARLRLEWHYDGSRFARERVERLSEQYKRLLDGVLRTPATLVAELEVVTAAELELLRESNKTAVSWGAGAALSLPEWVERACERSAARVAVEDERSQLSYGELNQAANRLARHLQSLGAGPEQVVGVALERGVGLVVGLLAVLKTGAAYLPLDGSYPAARLALMVEQSGAQLLLSETGQTERLPERGVRRVLVDAEAAAIARHAGGNLPGRVGGEQLAYVIYTSGSTGQPKGVMVSHRAICNRLLWMQQQYPLGAADAVLQKTASSFDASIWEVFVPLLSGARLVLARPGGQQDPGYLVGAIKRHRITTLQVVPTLLRALVEEAGFGECESLRRVYSGGEALEPRLVERFYQRLSGVQLHNLYGPTECAIDATHMEMERGGGGERVLIGKPLANTRIYILDRRQRQAPLGVVGELYVSGVQLARGYLQRAELTAERFLPDPFSGEPGVRMYRSGDLGRVGEDGTIEYLGRGDQQVKLRGYRIELGEVEAAACTHPGVGEAVARLIEDDGGHQRLALYVVGRGGQTAAISERELVELPNGLEVAVVNRSEASVLYQEIYETGGHLGRGIELEAGAVVFDVGANIGLFTLYLSDHWRQLRIYAFEPVPEVFERLRLNVGLYGLEVKLYECGLWQRSGDVELVYYPNWSSMTGAYGDAGEELEVTRRILERRGGEVAAHAEELMAGRFAGERRRCRMRTVSEVLAEEGLERIDLLKVDVEKSEQEVLAGIREEDWEKIKQLMMEVHDREGRLRRIEQELEGRGYQVKREQEAWLEGTGLYNLYAVRREELARRAANGAGAAVRAGSNGAGGLLRRVGLSVSEVRRHLTGRLPEYMVPSAIVMMERLPLSASGKVDRAALPDPAAARLSGGGGGYVAARSQREAELSRIWSEVLGAAQVGIHDNFFELGGDSILSLQVIARAARAGLRLTPKQVFDHPTVAELAAVADESGEQEGGREEESGEVVLTPIQARFMREQPEAALSHYNQAVLLEVAEGLEERLLEETLRELLSHHDALRMRYEQDEAGQWRQHNEPVSAVWGREWLHVIDLSEVGEEEQRAVIEETAGQFQGSLNLVEGRLLRVALIRTSSHARLLLVIHHLVVDGVSWRVLLEDLQSVYEQLAAGAAVRLPAKSTSYRSWAAALAEYADSEAVTGQAEYWLEQAEAAVMRLAEDGGGENRTASAAGVFEELSEAYTSKLLKQAPEVYHTQINDLLLAALALALQQWRGAEAGQAEGTVRVKVNLEGHGRHQEIGAGLDLTRTVGWFTALYPVVLEVRAEETLDAHVKRVKEQLRGVPEQGLGYGLLRYLRDDEVSRRLEAASEAQLSFNYLGQTDQVLEPQRQLGLRPAGEGVGPSAAAESRRAHLIDVNALVSGGRLRVAFSYARQLIEREAMERLAKGYLGTLERLIDYLLSEAEGGHTPSDFELAAVSQEKLDEWEAGGAELEQLYGLSPLQEGLLFHSLYEQGQGLYVVQWSYRLEGELDERALERAWAEVTRRHEALRTGYEWEGVERMVAVVRQAVELRWERLDWSELSAESQEQRLEQYLEEERQRGFDVRQAPLMRQALIRLGTHQNQFVWTHHHLIMDGWSGSMLVGEVARLYEAYAQGQEPEAERGASYRAYMKWLSRQDLKQAERYWRERLAGISSPTPLGVEKAAGSEAEPGYSKREKFVGRELTIGLEEMARSQQVTLNTVVQGAWAILLSRYSGRDEVLYGVTVSGRPAELVGVEQMVGMFINTLPVRVKVDGQARVDEWFKEMQREQVEMRQYEYSPLVQVQGWSELPKGVPMFDSIYAFENYPVDQTLREWKGSLRAQNVKLYNKNNNPLTVAVAPGPRVLLQIQFDTDRIEGKSIERLLDHFEKLLQGFVTSPGAKINDLFLILDDAERQEEEEREEQFAEACLDKLKGKIKRKSV